MSDFVAPALSELFGKIEMTHLLFGMFVTAVIILVSSWFSKSSSNESLDGKSLPRRAGSWMPFLGNLPDYLMGPETTMKRYRDENKQGLYNLNLFTSQKTIVYSAKLLEDLDRASASSKDGLQSRIDLASRGFGRSHQLPRKLEQILPVFEQELSRQLESQMAQLTQNGLRRLERSMPSMITFLENPIDQHLWEKMSGTVVSDDGQAIETGLFGFVQTFLTFLTIDHLFTPSFYEEKPDIVPLLWTAISNLKSSLLKPKILAPHPQAVLRALDTLIDPFITSLRAADDDESASYLAQELADSKSPFIKALRSKLVSNAEFDAHGTLLTYIVALTIIPHTLVPWAMLQIIAPRSNLEDRWSKFHTEVEANVSVKQEEGIGSIMPPVDVQVDHSKLRVCRTLIADAERLYSNGWDEYTMKEDVTITDQASEGWLLRKGSRVTTAYWLQDKTLPSPEAYEQAIKDDLRSLGLFRLPYLSGYLFQMYSTFLAIFFRLYSVELVNGSSEPGYRGEPSIPEQQFSPGVALPSEDVRVRIKKRY